MLRILESQAPAKQTATDTIATLSSRLASATLLEDRRAAILGLRSFAKLFPASVASSALRDLITALRRDGADSDTVKVVLETLLMLFEPDEKSTEASEEIMLWLADEFTQRQDNVTVLLDLLEPGDFYLRLYSLQILSHVCIHRPQRTKETVLAAPLGVSRVTAVLDDKREALRNEALLLLVALTPESAELQKVVAFENAFDRIFAIVESEGGLTHGSTVVQDCLTLLAHLLTLNPSNQSYFREMGYVTKSAALLSGALVDEQSGEGVSDWTRASRDMNLWGLLGVLQLFLARGSQGTAQAQKAFWHHRVLLHVLQIAFHPSFGTPVRARALETCGHIIRGNSSLQEQFGDLSVPLTRPSSAAPPKTNGHTSPNKDPLQKSVTPTLIVGEITNVIEALLGLTLEPSPPSLFEVRLAASNCVKSFIEGHNGIRLHVLRRAIEGHRSGDDAIPNMLTVLLEPAMTRTASDPYQVWMASVLLMHLLYENSETKTLALQVSEGNAEDGEEIVTFVQSVVSIVVAGVQHVEDERALLGYLMVLSIWLYEDPEAVNDLLGEGSNVHGLIAAVKVSSFSMPLVAGLCTLLLGIVYEFSTKDSPIPRSTLFGVIKDKLTREVYVDRLTKLRESPFVRDFEVLPVTTDGGLPEVYFDQTFMEFLKDNFSRFLRAIDRDPAFEVSIISNGVQRGVSRELVDTLRAELDQQKTLMDNMQTEVLEARKRFETEELEHRRTRESMSVDLGRIKNINESLQRNHDEEIQALQSTLRSQQADMAAERESIAVKLQREHATALLSLSQKNEAEKNYLEQRQSGHEREMTRAREKHQAEVEQLKTESQRTQRQLETQLKELRDNLTEVQAQLEVVQREREDHLRKVDKERNKVLESAQAKASQTEQKFATAQEELKTLRAELDSIRKQLQTSKESLSAAESKVKEVGTRASKSESKIKEATDKVTAAEGRAKKAEDKASLAETRAKKAEDKVSAAETRAKKAEESLKKVESTGKTAGQGSKSNTKAEARVKELEKELQSAQTKAEKAADIQTELDDLLVVFADLEAKRTADKKKLKELGQDVSEDEDEDEEDDGDGDGDGDGDDHDDDVD